MVAAVGICVSLDARFLRPRRRPRPRSATIVPPPSTRDRGAVVLVDDARPGQATPRPRRKQIDRRAALREAQQAGRGARVERTRTATSRPAPTMLAQVAVAEPVHVRKADRPGGECLARPDDHLRGAGIETHHVERLADREPKPAPLADRVVDDALVRGRAPGRRGGRSRRRAPHPASGAR